MFGIHVRPSWWLPERAATEEKIHLDRRRLLRSFGIGAGLLLGRNAASLAPLLPGEGERRTGIPRRKNPDYRAVGRPLTPERLAATYNNFYEFTTDKRQVHMLAGDFRVEPWEVEFAGLFEHEGRYSVRDLEALVPPEERVYRFRCVEAWSMVVPWTGLPLGDLLRRLGLRREARFLRFVTVSRPEAMPGMKALPSYPWPYFEALRIDEALHPLTLLATGIYGKALPPQNGAPVRLVVPWKYGLKNIKSIVRIEATRKRPPTLWNRLQPAEYSWLSNVEPWKPHPRWSQATERRLDTGERIPTLPYNGYAAEVGSLYRD